MDFLAGAMLWGTLAAAIPILIHLTGRARPVVHRFPAMRFLLRSHRSSSRALRLKHLLLLLLRMGVLALLAFVLARPLFHWFGAGALPAADLHGDFVLVLDASLSMHYRETNTECFERAREQALRFLDRLAPESRVALIRAGAEPERLQGRLTLDQAAVRARLTNVTAAASGLDLGRALEAAQAILARDAGTRPGAVLFFTDLQRNAYDGLASPVPAPGAPRPNSAGPAPGAPSPSSAGPDTAEPGLGVPNWPLVVVDVGVEGARNGAVLSVRLPGPAVAAGQPIALAARVRPVDSQRVFPVDLYVDRLKVGQQAVDPRGAAEVDVQFTFPAGAAGPHSGSLQLAQSDGLMLDQQRAFAYEAGWPPRALVVQQPDASPGRGSAFFLRAALATAAASSASGLAATLEDAADLHAGRLAGQQCVVLADCGELSETLWQGLGEFVEEGGGLFAWLGPRTPVARGHRRHGYSDFARHRGLLPGLLGDAVHPDKPLAIRVAQPDHPLLARFPPGVLSDLRSVEVRYFVKVTPEAKDPAVNVILELADGSPLLLEKPYGRGRVLLCTTGPEETGSDLPKRGAVFLTLVLEACQALSGRGEKAAAKLGRPLVLAIPDPPGNGQVAWKPPGGQPERMLALEAEAAEGAAGTSRLKSGRRLLVPRLEAPGIHTFTWHPLGGGTRTLLVAANPDEGESDLTRIRPDEAVARLKPWPATVVREVEEAAALSAQTAWGRELPVPLLLAVLAVLIAESYLANRLYRAVGDEAEGGEKAAGKAAPGAKAAGKVKG